MPGLAPWLQAHPQGTYQWASSPTLAPEGAPVTKMGKKAANNCIHHGGLSVALYLVPHRRTKPSTSIRSQLREEAIPHFPNKIPKWKEIYSIFLSPFLHSFKLFQIQTFHLIQVKIEFFFKISQILTFRWKWPNQPINQLFSILPPLCTFLDQFKAFQQYVSHSTFQQIK